MHTWRYVTCKAKSSWRKPPWLSNLADGVRTWRRYLLGFTTGISRVEWPKHHSTNSFHTHKERCRKTCPTSSHGGTNVSIYAYLYIYTFNICVCYLHVNPGCIDFRLLGILNASGLCCHCPTVFCRVTGIENTIHRMKVLYLYSRSQ